MFICNSHGIILRKSALGVIGVSVIICLIGYIFLNMRLDPYFLKENELNDNLGKNNVVVESTEFNPYAAILRNSVDPVIPLAPFIAASTKDPPSGVPVVQNDTRNLYPLPKRIAVSYAGSPEDGVGLLANYTSLDILFGPDYAPGHVLPLVDLRGTYFNSNTFAGSAGIVTRYIPQSFCALIGVNAYYDFRGGSKGNFNQIGVGFELLGERWDFRANGFIPVGRNKHKSTCLFNNYIGDYFIKRDANELSFYGANAEIGRLLFPSETFLVYAAGGPYYLTGKVCSNAWGGYFRMRPQYKDYIALDLSVSHDTIFKTVFQAQIIISIPLYQMGSKSSKIGPCGITNRQVYQPVIRFDAIPINKRCSWDFNY